MMDHESIAGTECPGNARGAAQAGRSRCLAHADKLIKSGQWVAAEQLLRGCLADGCASEDVVALLAQALWQQHRVDECLALLEHHVSSATSISLSLRMLHARWLLAAQRANQAIDAFKQVLALDEQHAQAHLGLAQCLGLAGQSGQARLSAQQALRHGLDTHVSRSVLARACFESRRYAEAEIEFTKALRHNPWDVSVHAPLAELIWMRTRELDAATTHIDATLAGAPSMVRVELQLTKARLLSTAGRKAQAVALLERLAAEQPAHVGVRAMQARTLLDIDPTKAHAHAEQAVRLAPGNPGPIGLYADTLLATGRPDAAASVAQRLLDANPHDNHARALLSSAWRMLGDPRHASLADYASLVQVSALDVPSGWSSRGQYLDDLAADLRSEHQLLGEPVNQSVRGGTQIEHRLHETSLPALRAFGQAIHGAIDTYIARIRTGESSWHRRATAQYKLRGLWSVRLRSQGHHVNHFHGQGWISSACHIRLPQATKRGGQGWLAFGQPGSPTQPPQGPEYVLRPEPGVLALFPSWMWHGTLPFECGEGEDRLTVAFDVVPA